MKTFDTVKDLNLDELRTALSSTREEQFKLRFKKSRGDLKQTHLLRKAKIKVAQILTLISQKKEEV